MMSLLKNNEAVINLEVLRDGTTVLYKGEKYEWHEGSLWNKETNEML